MHQVKIIKHFQNFLLEVRHLLKEEILSKQFRKRTATENVQKINVLKLSEITIYRHQYI